MRNEITISQTIKKYSVLICIAISLVLIIIATSVYPGGSLLDKNSTGFDWTENFFSNLFEAKAINGMDNPSRIWAVIGMAFHSIGYGLFFINTSAKIIEKHTATVLKVIGIINIIFDFLIATPLHDIMIIISSTLSLLGVFYITVYSFKTKLNLLKFSCVTAMLIFYYTLFLYGFGDWALLAIMQKIAVICSMFLILGIEYFTNKVNFNPMQADKV